MQLLPPSSASRLRPFPVVVVCSGNKEDSKNVEEFADNNKKCTIKKVRSEISRVIVREEEGAPCED